MVQLGAANIPAKPELERPANWPDADGEKPASAREAVGRRVLVYWQASGMWTPGEVLSFNPKTGRHHVLYNDGEDEWLELAKESLAWESTGRPLSPLVAGQCQGMLGVWA